MKYRELGNSGINVSPLCLGTMTFGEQNTEEEGFEQLDFAFEKGINFIDTAEMYPIPPKDKTYSKTETIIGNWINSRNNRDKVVLATKVVGPGFPWVRDGNPKLNKSHIQSAVEQSLIRLKTDYIDLYQIHWPERKTNFFGQRGYNHSTNETTTPIEETFLALKELTDQGKIRSFGVSNETPWGMIEYLRCCEKYNYKNFVSVQNPYNLLNRLYEVGMAEISYKENIGLLAYSPLAFGTLTGKYLNNQKPKNARLSLFNSYGRYTKPNGVKATEKYVNIAKKFGISPTQMALAFVTSRKFVTSNIIGATNLKQLAENIDSINIEFTEEMLHEVNMVQEAIPNPSP